MHRGRRPSSSPSPRRAATISRRRSPTSISRASSPATAGACARRAGARRSRPEPRRASFLPRPMRRRSRSSSSRTSSATRSISPDGATARSFPPGHHAFADGAWPMAKKKQPDARRSRNAQPSPRAEEATDFRRGPQAEISRRRRRDAGMRERARFCREPRAADGWPTRSALCHRARRRFPVARASRTSRARRDTTKRRRCSACSGAS